MAISVNMLRLRVTSERHPRAKNGAPAHTTTGVANTSWIQFETLGATNCSRSKRWPPISSDDDGDGERQPDPEPALHVDQLDVRAALRRHRRGLKRHAADRAGARPDLADLRVHRAGVDRALRRGRRLRRALWCREIALGVGEELLAAARRAEIVGRALDARPNAWPCLDRRSFRRPDPLHFRRAPRAPWAACVLCSCSIAALSLLSAGPCGGSSNWNVKVG